MAKPARPDKVLTSARPSQVEPIAARPVVPRKVQKAENPMLRLLLLILVALAIVGSVPMWGYSTGWGYGPSGGLGVFLLILLILVVLGRI